jgi:hypothetical protein
MKCRGCGTELPARAMFCGECGFSVTVPKLVEPPNRGHSSDTAVMAPLPQVAPTPPVAAPSSGTPAGSPPSGTPAAAQRGTHSLGPDSPIRLIPAYSQSATAAASVHAVPPRASFPERLRPRGERDARPVTEATGQGAARPETAFEDTRVVQRSAGGERFVLQFSTGESTTVFGSGLIGRNPVVQPGESFDHIVSITDPAKSVSKTHLEFGQAGGTFWVSDRFSGNGTVVRQPEERPQRLQPGKRQTVARGTRIDIAEQFFIVS